MSWWWHGGYITTNKSFCIFFTFLVLMMSSPVKSAQKFRKSTVKSKGVSAFVSDRWILKKVSWSAINYKELGSIPLSYGNPFWSKCGFVHKFAYQSNNGFDSLWQKVHCLALLSVVQEMTGYSLLYLFI